MKPALAIVGAVNHGKSSVAATLAEDDQIGISDFPGETTICKRFDCRELFTLWDTPGFQDPRRMLREIRTAMRGAADPLAVFRAFSTRHTGDHEFEAECELLRPLLDGASIFYVVDTSKAFERKHEDEMELLRLTGRPRLAVLNPTAAPMHEVEWRARLGQHFGAVHEFNAHHASAHDRAELLRAMAAVADQWKIPLREAAVEIEKDWEQKLREAAQVMVELIEKSLTHTERKILAPDRLPDKDAVIETLKLSFRDSVTGIEKAAHCKLKNLFRHSRVETQPDGTAHLSEGLFSEETWRVWGLGPKALAVIGATVGGAAGATGGAMVGAHGELVVPSGVPTATGTAVGGVGGALIGGIGAVVLGKKVAQPKVRVVADGSRWFDWMRRKTKDAAAAITRTGTEITVGPQRGENFPYILLDRALGLFCYLHGRTHARRDVVHLEAARLKDALDRAEVSTATLSDSLRSACEKYVAAVRKEKIAPEIEKEFRDLLAGHLEAASTRPFDYISDSQKNSGGR